MKNRIEEIRTARGIRQEELAGKMGVSRQTISSLENGRYNPSIMLAHRIAHFLGWQSKKYSFLRRNDHVL